MPKTIDGALLALMESTKSELAQCLENLIPGYANIHSAEELEEIFSEIVCNVLLGNRMITNQLVEILNHYDYIVNYNYVIGPKEKIFCEKLRSLFKNSEINI